MLGEATALSFTSVDTSPAFRAFLDGEGAGSALEACGLEMRERHRVVAPRLGVADVGASWDTVPDFSVLGPEEEYALTRLHTGVAMQERYVEVVRRGSQ